MKSILETLLLFGGNIIIWSSILQGLIATVVIMIVLHYVRKFLSQEKEPSTINA